MRSVFNCGWVKCVFNFIFGLQFIWGLLLINGLNQILWVRICSYRLINFIVSFFLAEIIYLSHCLGARLLSYYWVLIFFKYVFPLLLLNLRSFILSHLLNSSNFVNYRRFIGWSDIAKSFITRNNWIYSRFIF